MFGYVVADQANLKPEELERYRGAYCGLCRAIGQRHGQHARLVLTYDMTFLSLLMNALYEPEEQAGSGRCLPHPVHARDWHSTAYTDYAADLNVALAYYNCLDDWQDDRNVVKLVAAKSLEPAYRKVCSQWPEQCSAIETQLKALSAFEAEKSPDLDGACRCFGDLMAALFTVRADHWTETLQSLGRNLGAFIYLMDAFLDRKEDDRKGRYNPISAFEAVHGPFDAFQALTMLIGDCTLAFERLPLEQDLGLLRNILYSGVWTRYAIDQQRRENRNGRTTRKEEHTT
ncbi:MAG: DUF5685 family protein [Candidatus Onthomonas sp.]